MSTRKDNKLNYRLFRDTLEIEGDLTFHQVAGFLQYYNRELSRYSGHVLIFNLDGLDLLDSGGVTAIHYVRDKLSDSGVEVQITGGDKHIRKKLEIFSYKSSDEEDPEDGLIRKPGYFERLGRTTADVFNTYVTSFFQLSSEISYWSVVGLFTKRSYRKGEVANQAVQMGVNAILVVGMMSFIIGLVLALQSAAQLRSFGANIYIVDLTVIAMMSEMGPLITAIMVAGRSGASIAAEIATMKVTSETDALKTMGLDPVRYVVVPKMYGGLITMPFLTIIADVLGIIGGMLIAMSYLDISPVVFMNRMGEVLYMKDIVFGIVKSLVFIYLIVISGSYFGFSANKIDAGVGSVTTGAVVFSIALVIFADSIMGLFFY